MHIGYTGQKKTLQDVTAKNSPQPNSTGYSLTPFCHKTFHPEKKIIWGVDGRMTSHFFESVRLTLWLTLGSDVCFIVSFSQYVPRFYTGEMITPGQKSSRSFMFQIGVSAQY